MNKVNVGLGGISRNTDDGVSKDGMCSELINARPKNGSIEPVGRPILERQFAEGKSPVFVHKNGTYEHLISYANDIVLFDSDKVDGQWVVKNTAFAQIPGVKQIQSVGNILVMATGESIHYAIFIGGEYTYLGDQIPEPSIRFSCIKEEAVYSDDISCNLEPAVRIQDVGSLATLNEAGEKIITNSFKASYYKLLQEDVYDAGHVIYPVLVRYAVRLFDESYVMHSSPLLVGEPNFIRMAVSKTKFDFDSLSVEGFTYKLIANPRTIGVKYDLSGLSGWKDVASSVDIFVSRPFVINDLDSTIKTVTVLDKNNMMVDLPFKSESELLEEIGEISNFYLVKSIPIGDISNGFENIFAEGKAFKNLEQQEVATLKKQDRNLGLAIIAIKRSDLSDSTRNQIQTAMLGNSNAVNRGDGVIVLGEQFGYAGGVGYGIISSTRNYRTVADGQYRLLDTDIAGSEKGSGILFNTAGEVIGICDQSELQRDGNLVSAYAISDIKEEIELLANGQGVPYIGVHGVVVTEKLAGEQGIPKGIYVREVEADSPAMQAGIQNGDVITEINKTDITGIAGLHKQIAEAGTGTQIRIKGQRRGADGYVDVTFDVTVGSKE